MNIANVQLERRYLERRRRARRRQAYNRDALEMRNLRDASNPFEMPEKKFMAKYRLTRRMALALCEELRHHMRDPQRATAVPNHLKVGHIVSISTLLCSKVCVIL